MSGATNPMDNVHSYVGLLSNPEPDRPADPPDGTRINGRYALPDEVDVIKAAREQERARCAATVAGVGRGRLAATLTWISTCIRKLKKGN